MRLPPDKENFFIRHALWDGGFFEKIPSALLTDGSISVMVSYTSNEPINDKQTTAEVIKCAEP